MNSNGKNAGPATPAKNPQTHRSKTSEIPQNSENSNPNLTSPRSKPSKSPAIKSATKAQKSAPQNPNPVAASPSRRNKIRDRKFVVAKRNSKKDKKNSTTVECKCKNNVRGDSQKCLCVAYESLKASQEEFFNRGSIDDDKYDLQLNGVGVEKVEKNPMIEKSNDFAMNGPNCDHPDKIQESGEMGTSQIKRRRDNLLEEERDDEVPEPGSGRVLHLVKAFERLLTIPNSKDFDQKDEKVSEDDHEKGMKWALPGLQQLKVSETQVSSSSFCPADFVLTSASLGLDTCVSSSLDSSHGSFTISSRISGGTRRSRRNSSGSSGTFGGSRWKKQQLKATCQKPFNLQTEQRGRYKEEEFTKKVQEMMMEEEKQRIRIAQGLPWTTDEPECLVKPPIKEITMPVDLVLNSDVRALERAEFDHQVAEKLSLIEQYRMERERQQKLAEEEEIRRLRKELVPKAQPLPYFDRPFLPRRSLKHPTIPREPKFHFPHHKKIKCSFPWNGMYSHQQ